MLLAGTYPRSHVGGAEVNAKPLIERSQYLKKFPSEALGQSCNQFRES